MAPADKGRAAPLRRGRCLARSRSDNVEALDDGEERPRERRLGRALAHLVPGDLLAQRPSDLEHLRIVGLLLLEGEQLGHHEVLERDHGQAHRHHLALLGTPEPLVADRPAARAEDEIDQDVAVPDLVQPVLRRAVGAQARPGEGGLGAFGVLRLEEEIHVVIGLGPAARPCREPAAEGEGDPLVAQDRGHLLERADEGAHRALGRHAAALPGPESP